MTIITTTDQKVKPQASFIIPAHRMRAILRKKRVRRVGKGTPVMLAAGIEMVLKELMTTAKHLAGKKRIQSLHIMQAINDDRDYRILFSRVRIPYGGQSVTTHPTRLRRIRR